MALLRRSPRWGALAAGVVVACVAPWCSANAAAEGEGAKNLNGATGGGMHEPTEAEVDAAQAQIHAMFNTVKAIVGTVLAVILGFYGWTFWTSIKCFFAKEQMKRQQAAKASSTKSGGSGNSEAARPAGSAAADDETAAADTSIPPIDRQLRPIGPYRLRGTVVKGFGRGSSELGWPTANLDPAAFKGKIDDSEEGVYIAWAQVVGGASSSSASAAGGAFARHASEEAAVRPGKAPAPATPVVHKALVSVGWNPAYDNKEKTVEAYLCSDFPGDFYGAELRLLIMGYLRPQVKFASADWLAELKAAIQGDVDVGSAALDDAPWAAFARDRLFHSAGAH